MIAALFVTFVAIACFGAVIVRTHMVEVLRSLLDVAEAGVSAMLDSELDDGAKEVAVRRAGVTLLGKAWQLLWRLGLSLAAAAIAILVAEAFGIAQRDVTLGLMTDPRYLLAVSAGALAGWIVLSVRRKGREAAAPGAASYGAAERLLHALAFMGPKSMRAAASIDDAVFRLAGAPSTCSRPVFLTSLARGGTTALLNAFHDIPSVATHEYRDMPFLLAPVLWSKFGGRRRSVVRRERAHGDGLEIDLDSPEAFDEVLWRLFWPEKYGDQSIELWRERDAKPQATTVFTRHIAKITYLRRPARATDPGTRYVSKNNSNLARLRLLPKMFPQCEVVIALRHPAAHAESLLRQHLNFLRLQSEDDFVRRYMRDIGHLEFGLLHRPIAFDGFDTEGSDPRHPDYWLAYWIAAFREVWKFSASCHVVAQGDLRAKPQVTMSALCERLRLSTRDVDFSRYFRTAPDAFSAVPFSPVLMTEANLLYEDLRALAVR